MKTILSVIALALPLQAGTYTAVDCNQSSVNAVINGPTHTAVDGDVINIPAGTCTWTSGITVPSNIGISIIGAGAANTIITTSYNGQLFVMRPQYGNSLSRFSSMTIQPTTGAGNNSNPIMVIGTCAAGGCPNLRVDNINFPAAWVNFPMLGSSAKIIADNVFGVLDHNSVNGSGVLVNVSHSAWAGVGQFGDNSWASADSFGAAQTLFIESNTFNATGSTDTDLSDSFQDIGGGRFAVRFNTFTNVDPNGSVVNHGTESTGRPRGGRQVEAYGNTFSCSNTSSGCASPVSNRSGVMRTFLNSYTKGPGTWFNNFFTLSLFRVWAGFQPWDYCNGLGPYDSNDGTVYASGTISGVSTGPLVVTDSSKTWTTGQWVNSGAPYSIVDTTINDSSQGQSPPSHPGWEITASGTNSLTSTLFASGQNYNGVTPAVGDTYQILRATVCIDQPTRSGGTLLSGGTPTAGAVNQTRDPTYEWGDIMTDGSSPNAGVALSQSARVIANRDYYGEVSQSIQTSSTSPFNGTVGTGYGTLANRPATCTTGVGYYATDQGTWNASGANFPGQSFSQGQFYRCSSTNTWTLSYTPYTYPHPLVGGGAPTAPAITSTSPLPAGTQGTAYSYQFTATGTTPITWTATGVPAGLALSSSGLLSGTPTAVTTYSFNVTATNSVGSAGPVAFSITINAAASAPPAITSTSPLPAGTQGAAYSYQFTATGLPPITWAATGVPSGLALSSAGLLSGTPTVAATSTINVTATNVSGSAGPTGFSLTVQPVILPSGAAAAAAGVRFSGGAHFP